MIKRLNIIRCIVLFFLTPAFIFAAVNPLSSSDQVFFGLSNAYFDQVYFKNNPTLATQLGIHDYDNQLEDYSEKAILHDIKMLKEFETRLLLLNPRLLHEESQGDYDLILNDIRSTLLTLQVIKPWQKNPDCYSSEITNSAFVIMERNFASSAHRLHALIAREKLMPIALDTARHNLKNPPRIYTQIALEQLPAIIDFFKKDVPEAFQDVQDPQLQKQFSESNKGVIKALISYQKWLKTKILPHSNGEFRIGAKTFQQKLHYDEMVDTPLKSLLQIGWNDLRKNQKDFKRISKELFPNKSHKEILALLALNHPPANQVLKSFSDQFEHLITFIQDKKIITIPSDHRPTMLETPPFMRATTIASMDTPGPFEAKAKEAYFNVTLPDLKLNARERNEFLGRFNYAVISGTSVHEAYPGHYIQFLWTNKIHDRVRKILGANSNAEGWAHYCEQMMLDEGYGKNEGEKAVKLLRLGQLIDALLRDARFIVGIEMHTRNMSLDQAIDFFVKEAYQTRSIAEVEAKRGTMDPTYLYYTLGKLQIMKLREDFKAKEGSAFSLQMFHDKFMQQGFPPIKIVRKALLQNDSPVL